MIAKTTTSIIICLLFFGISNGQNTKKINVYSLDENSADNNSSISSSELFKNSSVPEKWKKESAVVLAQEFRYEFGNYNSPKFKVIVHKKIKLQDQNSVNNFSRFYSSDRENLVVEIIKSNGSVIKVNTENAISVNEAPQYFEDDFKTNSYYKLAIPGLEVGDIIDFQYQSSRWDLKMDKMQHYGFPLVTIHFQGKYPIIVQKYVFETNLEDHVTARFTQFKVPITLKKDEANKLYTYELVVSNQEKHKELNWEYSDLTIPSLKFQCVYSPLNSTKDVYRYFPRFKDGVLKDSINNEEWNYYLKKYIETQYPIVPIWGNKLTSSTKIKSDDADEIAMTYYYAFRDFYYSQSDINKEKDQYINDELFIKVFRILLDRKEIPYSVGIVFPKEIGDEKVITSFNEGTLFIEVNNIYYFPFTYYSLASEMPYWFENSTSFCFDVEKGKLISFKKKITPSSNSSENVTNYVKNISIDLTKKVLKVQELTTETGDEKSFNFQSLILNELFFDKRGKANINFLKPKVVNSKSLQELHNEKAEQAKKEQLLKCQLEYLKKSKEEDDDVFLDAYDSLKVFKTGRLAASPSVNYEEQYVISKEIHEIEDGLYVFCIGKLIGNQIALDQDEIIRSIPAYFGYSKTFKYEINVMIPSGYKVVGLESLNVEINNAICIYSSVAKQENGKIVWKIEKTYKKATVTVSEWPILQSMLDRAFDNTQKKVIFKRM